MLSIVVLALLSLSSLSHASSSLGGNQNWMFTGSEFNYSQKMVIREPSYDNVSKAIYYFEITNVGNQAFNFSEREKYYRNEGPLQNSTLPINASIILSRVKETGSYPGGSFFVVNSTVLNLISENASLFFNYKNASAPLNVSKIVYSYESQKIPSYKLSAIEPKYTYAASGQSQSYVIVGITLVIDSSNGIVLYENENQSYAEAVYYDTIFSIDGTNFQLVNITHSSHSDLPAIITAISVLVAISLIIYATRRGRR